MTQNVPEDRSRSDQASSPPPNSDGSATPPASASTSSAPPEPPSSGVRNRKRTQMLYSGDLDPRVQSTESPARPPATAESRAVAASPTASNPRDSSTPPPPPAGARRRARHSLPPLSFLPPAADPAAVREAANADLSLTVVPSHKNLGPRPTLTPPTPGATASDETLALLRTLPRRTRHGESDSRISRKDVLEDLVDHSPEGGVRARLLQASAHLADRDGAHALALRLRERAYAADANDLMVLRELRRHALAEGDFTACAKWLDRELKVPAHGTERASAAALLAALQAGPLSAPEAAAQSAQRARQMSEDAHLPALLLHAAALRATDRASDAAASLITAAKLVSDPPLRAALYLHAARNLQAAGQDEAVLQALADAAQAMPEEMTLHLEVARVAHRLERADAVQSALAAATQCAENQDTRSALKRMQAHIHLAQGAPEAALRLLNDAAQPEDVRLRVQAEARAQRDTRGDGPRFSALRTWAKVQTGDAKIAALCQLARRLLEQNDRSGARDALQDAERLAPGALLVRFTRNALLQQSPSAEDLRRAAEVELSSDGLAAVARLVFTNDLEAECELMAEVEGQDSHDTLQQLQLDAALHLGKVSTAIAGLQLWSEQLQEPAGPLLSALDLSEDPDTRMALLEQLTEVAADSPATLVERLDLADSDTNRALSFRSFAQTTHGASAAYGYYMAALYDRSDTEQRLTDLRAAVEAHAASAATFEYEQALLQRGDLLGHAQLQQLLATLAQGPLEQAKRLYAAASTGHLPTEESKVLLQEAQQRWPCDEILNEALLRACTDAPVEERALYLVASLNPDDSAAQRITHLRTGSEFERGERLTEALSHYQHVLNSHPEDPFARAGVVRCLERQGDRAQLVGLLKDWYQQSEHEPSRRRILIQLQSALRDRTDVTVLESLALLLERSSAHVPTLRALERIYGRMSKPALLREAAARLSRQLSNAKDRTAYLRLWLRLTPAEQGPMRHDEIVLDAFGGAEHEVPWYALALEAAARHRNDALTTARAIEYQGSMVTSPEDQASLALRAAEVLESVSLAKAAGVLQLPARRTRLHPTAAEELGRLCKAHGDYETAAEAYELAAECASGVGRKHWLLYLAAILYQEPLSQPERARTLFDRLVQEDPTYLDVLPRLESLLRDGGHLRDLARLYEVRSELTTDDNVRTRLSLDQHRLYMRCHEFQLAEQALRRGLTQAPDRVELLDALARLMLSRHRYQEAADTLLTLARRSEQPEQLRFALLTLGKLHLYQLPDLKRAEAALVRCLQLDAQDSEALEALADVYERDQRLEQATRVLGRLLELCRDVQDAERYTLRRAELLSRCNRLELAQRVLRDFLQAHPERLAALRTLVAIHRSADDGEGAERALADVAQGYKRTLLSAPATATPYLCLRETYRLAGRPAAESQVSILIDALCMEDAGFYTGENLLESRAIELDERVRAALLPPNLTEAARSFLDDLCGLMDATDPLPAYPRLAPNEAHLTAVEEVLARAAKQLGMEMPPVLCQGSRDEVRALHHAPPLIAIGQGHTPALVSVMALRALAMLEARLSAVTRMPAERFANYFYAVRQSLEPHFAPPAPLTVPEALLDAVRKTIEKQGRAHWERRLTDALGPMAVLSPDWLRTAAFQYGTRAALLLSDRPHDVFLLALHDDGLLKAPDPLYRHIAKSATAQQLLSFALSEDYLRLLERARL